MARQIQTAAFNVSEYEIRKAGAYRPRILPRHLRHLWLLKQHTGKPMTQLVAEALDEYFSTRLVGGALPATLQRVSNINKLAGEIGKEVKRMELLEKSHYTCLCVMCYRLIEYPLCNKCSEEADQLEKEALEKWDSKKKRPQSTGKKV